MTNASENVSKTRLYRERDILGIEFLYETKTIVCFYKEEGKTTYYFQENFDTKKIEILDDSGEFNDKPNRLLNLFKLKI